MTLHFAWPQFKKSWSLDVLGVTLADSEAPADVHEDTRRIRLDAVPTWSHVRLKLRLETTEAKPQGVGELEGYVLVSSARTNTRLPARLDRASETSFDGEVELPHDLLAGAVQIEGQVVTRGEPIRLVGTSDPWVLVVDASDAPPLPGAPAVETAWIKFSSPDAPDLARSAQDSYALMDFTGPKPTLLLNDDIKGFNALLNADRAQLERRRLRDTLGTSIARYALAALFREARAHITVEDGGEVSPPDDELSRQVCEAVAGEMKGVSDVDELYDRLANEITAPTLDRARLWVEIDNAVDRLTHHSEMIASVVEEVRHG